MIWNICSTFLFFFLFYAGRFHIHSGFLWWMLWPWWLLFMLHFVVYFYVMRTTFFRAVHVRVWFSLGDWHRFGGSCGVFRLCFYTSFKTAWRRPFVEAHCWNKEDSSIKSGFDVFFRMWYCGDYIRQLFNSMWYHIVSTHVWASLVFLNTSLCHVSTYNVDLKVS